MKTKLKLLLILFILLFVLPCIGVSCGGKSKKLIGTWHANTGCGPVTITFNKDGTGAMMGPMDSQTFKWEVKGNELLLTDESGKTERISFELEENTLTLHSPDGTVMTFFR